MKFPWKKEQKVETKQQEQQAAEILSEDVLGQIWGGVALKDGCHVVEAEALN